MECFIACIDVGGAGGIRSCHFGVRACVFELSQRCVQEWKSTDHLCRIDKTYLFFILIKL